eukprot:COSAG06_NODE_50805_length_316_cov_0.709677_2_plen_25_part_01
MTLVVTLWLEQCASVQALYELVATA